MASIPSYEQFRDNQHKEQLLSANHANLGHGFIVRIELHEVEKSSDYKALRDYMMEEGFQGVVANVDGVRFKLPTATYYYPHPGYMLSSGAVHEKASAAVQVALDDAYVRVKAANRIPTILVTETNDLYWTGLELADNDDE